MTVNSSLDSWQHLFSYTLTKFFIQVFFIAVVMHAWVGIRDIWMDYVNSSALRLTLYLLTMLWLLGSLIYSIKVIWA
jgi:succinate dehydrogenase / fumarate reductase membrane anchor subunit